MIDHDGRGMPLHQKILLGMVLGILLGLAANFTGARLETVYDEAVARPLGGTVVGPWLGYHPEVRTEIIRPLIRYVLEPVGKIFLNMLLLTVFGALGLVIAAIGIYGVMAYAVTQRTQEIGVRLAIGAGRWQVSWLFLKRALAQLTVGLILGVPAALALARVARFRLVEIEANDPVTMAGIVIVLTTVSLAACLLPVRKAARVDPAVALRND